MGIVITEDCKPKLGEGDHRQFAAGERHNLHPVHEERLIALGVAERAELEPEAKAVSPVAENKAIDPVIENKAAPKKKGR